MMTTTKWMAIAVVAMLAQPAAAGSWSVRDEISKLDDSRNVFVRAESLNAIPILGGARKGYPSLMIACRENVTNAWIYFDGEYMSDLLGHGRIIYRIDSRPARQADWQASSNNRALGLWTGAAAIPFIKALMEGTRLLVQATPVSANPLQVEFRIAGLSEAIKPLRAACGW